MAHLDDNTKSSPTIRTSIAGVLSKIIAIAAGESVGKFIFVYEFLTNNQSMVIRKISKEIHLMLGTTSSFKVI